MKKLLAMLLAVAMVLSMAACGGDKTVETTAPVAAETQGAQVSTTDGVNYLYTYNTYDSALGSNWNPHAWEMNNEDTMISFLTSPFVTMSIEDSLNGVYQWIYVAATSVTDVTAEHQDDLAKYAVKLPEGQTPETTDHGFVFEIALNPDMKWENGEAITADDYIYSMQQLLNPEMKNYRANLYYAGESAVAGGSLYYYSLDDGMYEAYTNHFASLDEAAAAGDVFINVWDFYGAEGYTDANGNECPNYVSITDETVYGEAQNDAFSGAELYAAYGAYFAVGGGYESSVVVYVENANKGAGFDQVGCYKVDDYTIRYVNESQIDFNYFLTSLTSNWLVYEDLYEAGKDTTGTLVTTDYCTSAATTMSFGPYRIESLQDGKQLVYVKNENYYRYTKDEETGRLVATTDFLVDGEYVEMYQTDKIVYDVMDNDAAKQAFMKGQLNEWKPTADDLTQYATSEQLLKAPETYTMSFFFNTNLEKLQEMDKSKGNQNSVVMSNINFRKAFSLAVDRSEFVGATEGWLPAYSMLNSLYYYDVYNDPTSSYRNSAPAKQAICNVYGVEYGEGTPYADLDAAYASINGYNLTEAQALMKTACEELVAAGLYKEGDPIHIRIGWAKGALASADNQQLALFNKYLNAAVEGSGFGTVELEAVGNINNRYDDTANGEYAIGYGAWGGAAFYPFRNFQVYCDPDQYSIHEAGCWDPTTETLTLTVEGQEVTKTWQDWSACMVGSGDMSGKSFETKLQILADLEENFMKFYYRIPFASTTACSLVSYKNDYYTTEYNIMYDYGGIELLTYNYTDAEWTDFVAEQGGTLSYE